MSLKEQPPAPVGLNEFRKGLCSDSFTTITQFIIDVVLKPLDWGRFAPDQKLRGILVAMHYKLIGCPTKCPSCGSDVYLRQKPRRDKAGVRTSYRYLWSCVAGYSACGWDQEIVSRNKLAPINLSNFLPFCMFLLMMKEDYRIEKVYAELKKTVSCNKCIDAWKQLYWETISNYLRNSDKPGCGISVGGPRERVVFDEGNCGVNVGIRKGAQQPHGRSVPGRISRKLPAQTKWKKGVRPTRQWKSKAGAVKKILKRPASMSAMLKRPSSATRRAMKAGTRFDKRTKQSCWVFCAVEVGSVRGGCKTHAAGTKRSVFSVLPPPSVAEEGKPRGWKSMLPVIKKHVKKGSHIVKDGWRGSTKAVQSAHGMRYKLLPEVIHEKHFRDPKTGLHTNDAESEINRLKQWMRKKYARLGSRDRKSGSSSSDTAEVGSTTSLSFKLDEFMFLKNVGNDMGQVMVAFQWVNGKAHRPRDV